MLVRRQLRSIPSGAPVADATVEMRRHSNNTIIASTTTDASGFYTFFLNGNPGPYYITSSYGNETQVVSSKAIGASGPTDIGSIPYTFRNWRNGYIPNIYSQLAVSASGSGMTVTVAPGIHLAQGIIFDQHDNRTFTIAAADATQPRIDRVVVDVVPPGGGENLEGRSRILIKTGTPSATPVAPALTQTTTSWQESLATVRVDAGVVAIASNKVTDTRTASWISVPDNSITGAMLQDGIVGTAKLVDASVTGAKIAAGAVAAGNIGTSTLRSTAELARVLKASADSGIPSWSHLSLGELSNVLATTPTAGQALVWNGSNWEPGSVASSSTSTTRQSQYKDTNFAATGNLSGSRTLGSASVTLTSGSWLVETQLHFTARNAGNNGTFTASLSGNAAPTGTDVSSRIFQTVGGVPRQVILTGRRIVSPTTSTTYTTTAGVSHTSGDVSDIRDGVVYIVATPR